MQSRMIKTERNTLSRDLFTPVDYVMESDDVWSRSLTPPLPTPVRITPTSDARERDCGRANASSPLLGSVNRDEAIAELD